MDTPEIHESRAAAFRPRLALVAFVLLLLGLGLLALWRWGPSWPGASGDDAMIAQGRVLYEQRCTSCHGASGRGDGPVARTLDQSPGDLSRFPWKRGDRPEEVVDVIANGVPRTSMSAWKGTFEEGEIRALAAYVYHLAGQPTPEALRSVASSSRRGPS